MLEDIASNPNVKNWASLVKTHYLILNFIKFGHLKEKSSSGPENNLET